MDETPKFTVEGGVVLVGGIRLTRAELLEMLRATEKSPPGRYEVTITGDGPRQVAWLFANNTRCLWVPNLAPGGGWHPLADLRYHEVTKLLRGETVDISYGRQARLHPRHLRED